MITDLPPSAPPVAESAAPPAPSGGRRLFPQNYDRTWELELLISGAVAFTLLQLPSAVDGAFDRIGPRLGEGLFQATMFAYIYVKIILYALIATFIVHLAARAYWVGLVGLTSVYPNGVRWEQTRYGPITKEFYRERLPSLQQQTAAVDRFCSILFSFATIIVLTFVSSTVVVIAMAGLSWLVGKRLLGWENEMLIFYGILALLLIPMLVASQMDKRWGERMGSRAKRAVRGALRIGYFSQLGALTATISNTLFTNIHRVKSVGIFYLAFVGLLAFFMVRDVMVRLGGESIDGYGYLPENPDSHSVAYWFYENQRGDNALHARAPSIQSDIIREPFVRLFLPYYPRRHNALVEDRCPDATVELREEAAPDERRRAELARTQTLVDCLAALQPITLNGQPLGDPGFRFYTRPDTGIRGLIAYLSTADLPVGENLLVVQPVPRPRPRDGDPPPTPHFIPFWVAR